MMISMLVHSVRFPLGLVRVKLDRTGLELAQRGGFDAEWLETDTTAFSTQDYREIVKAHLTEVYKAKENTEPSSITLNLASHQLIEDMTGWTKLNFLNKPKDA